MHDARMRTYALTLYMGKSPAKSIARQTTSLARRLMELASREIERVERGLHRRLFDPYGQPRQILADSSGPQRVDDAPGQQLCQPLGGRIICGQRHDRGPAQRIARPRIGLKGPVIVALRDAQVR